MVGEKIYEGETEKKEKGESASSQHERNAFIRSYRFLIHRRRTLKKMTNGGGEAGRLRACPSSMHALTWEWAASDMGAQISRSVKPA